MSASGPYRAQALPGAQSSPATALRSSGASGLTRSSSASGRSVHRGLRSEINAAVSWTSSSALWMDQAAWISIAWEKWLGGV